MGKLTVERTLVYRSKDGSLTRYEILRTDGNPANNIDSILVYREADVGGQKTWVMTGDNISLNHLGIPSSNIGTQTYYGMRASRDVSSAVDECSKHWSQHYE